MVPADIISGVALLLLALAGGLLCLYYLRHARLREFAQQVTRDSPSEREAALALARQLYFAVRRCPNPRFLSPLLAPLGASPVAILEHGGCCSGIHRLFITALETLGIRASQITVYGKGPDAVHCLVQVRLGDSVLIIDVDYGVWYRQANGNPVCLGELRAGVVPVVEPYILEAGAVRIEGRFRTPPGYPKDPYFDFDYRVTRTANWTMSRARRIAYALLNPLTRGRVNSLLLPPMFEWPELVLSLGLAVTGVLILAAQEISLLA